MLAFEHSNILPTEVVVVEESKSVDTSRNQSSSEEEISTIGGGSSNTVNERLNNDNDNNNNNEEEWVEPQRPDTCVTNRDRYSWRKWIKCWRETQKMNETRREACRNSGNEFRADVLPPWSPTWKKKHGWTWKLDLESYEEEANVYWEREDAKINGRPMYMHYCDDDDLSNMSSPRQVYSDDSSFDSGSEYNSDF